MYISITVTLNGNFNFFLERSIPLAKQQSFIDGPESKLAMRILAITEESQKTSIISYFATYSFYDQT